MGHIFTVSQLVTLKSTYTAYTKKILTRKLRNNMAEKALFLPKVILINDASYQYSSGIGTLSF